MSTYTVQMQQVDYIVGEMQAISTRLKSAIDTLNQQADASLAEWTGDAQAVYNQQKTIWTNSADDMVTKANLASSQLDNINQAYASGERQGVNLWQQG
jgi:WXG100 family type VII secretion target